MKQLKKWRALSDGARTYVHLTLQCEIENLEGDKPRDAGLRRHRDSLVRALRIADKLLGKAGK